MDALEGYFQGEHGLDPELLRIKHAKMAASVFDFYRGTAGVFYRLWSHQRRLFSPLVWICGDAHWENVGSYKGKNHVPYFDFTDFDNAYFAPASFDLGRAIVGLYVVGKGALAPLLLSAYRKELADGKPYHIEAEVARGTVAELLCAVGSRSQRKFVKDWAKKGRFRIREGETYRLSAADRRTVAKEFRRWAQTMKNPDFFKLLDLCGSYAGLGVLGHKRYLLLVAGNNAPHLIDMKEAVASAAGDVVAVPQPRWANEAERIAEVQRIVQYVPIARLGWTRGKGRSYVLSEFQPAEDRIDSLKLSPLEYRDFAAQWGKLLAWAHLRGGGWRGAATTSELMDFATKLDRGRQRRLLEMARQAAASYKKLFLDFRHLLGADAG